jgi:UDP-N-acetylmuramoylalanine--D-glutamate ligase
VVNADDTETQITSTADPLPAGSSAAREIVSFGKTTSSDWTLVDNGELQFRGVAFAVASDFAIIGQHNLLNLLAAFALIACLSPAAGAAPGSPGLLSTVPPFNGNEARYVAAAASFTGLAHRAELVRELAGVRFVNDSKATNVGSCVAALEGFPTACPNKGQRPKVLLLAGGQGKGADFTPLGQAAAGRVKMAFVFGEDAEQLAAALIEHTTVECSATLEEAFERARVVASSGDTVLLAPACASFDMFTSFVARGNRFRELVEALS